MPWTTPKINWTVGELVTADDFNTMGENLVALKDLLTAESAKRLNSASGSSSQSLEINTGKALIMATISVSRQGNDFQLTVDGRRVGLKIRANQAGLHLSHIETGLSPGTHNFGIWAHRGSNNHVGATSHLSVTEIT